MSKIVITIFLPFLIACNKNFESQNANADYSQIKMEIENLDSLQDKKKYLEGILQDDQSVRDHKISSEIITQFGRDSKESHDFGKAMRQQDEINLYKVEYYLLVHEYPDKEMGENATTAPWMVIHHAPEYEPRERNFRIIYDAYLKGSIGIDALSFFLGRMYEMKFGKRHRMENPYQMEDEVSQLMKKLGLKAE
jgi:hypothetical protein